MLIGKRLRELRKEKGLNQEELGKLINVTKVSVCCYEKGVRTPNLETLEDLANIFNVSVDYLLGNDLKIKVQSKEDEEFYITIPKEIALLIKEIKADADLYKKVLGEDPKRIRELLSKLIK